MWGYPANVELPGEASELPSFQEQTASLAGKMLRPAVSG
jgi:hypothetical protein